MIGTEDFNWRGTKLFLGKQYSGFKVDNLENVNQWRVYWPDGVSSKDFYNLSWAKEHCVSEASKHFNNTEKGTTQAH
jgi:hypothetical protein